MKVYKEPLSKSIKKTIFEGFEEHAIESVGFSEFSDVLGFFIKDQDGNILSAVVVQVFWGSLQVKYVWTHKDHRRQGYAKKLMEEALDYGRKNECEFAAVETMSFQAPEFYKKFGFSVDFERKGYKHGVSYIYMKKDLEVGR